MDERIVIFRLPYRGPTDEFDGLRRNLRYRVSWVNPHEFDGRARVIVLPGSSRTVDDLIYLRQSGGADAIARHLADGGTVLGVCGGYQILGERLDDPKLAQGPLVAVDGLGYLSSTTVFGPAMASMQTSASLLVGTGAGGTVVGEERRSGVSFASPPPERSSCVPLLEIRQRRFHRPRPAATRLTAAHLLWAPGTERFDGLVSADRRVWGTYLHQICDNDAFLRTFFAVIS